MSNSEKQRQLAREILMLADLSDAEKLIELRALSSAERPSLAILFGEQNDISKEAKARLVDYAKDTLFVKEVVNIVIEHSLINTSGEGWITNRNKLIRFSFLLSKYFGLKQLKDLTEENWTGVIIALVDDDSVWRVTSSFSIQHAARIFIRAYNAVHPVKISLRAHSSRGRAKNARFSRQSQIQYLSAKSETFDEWRILFEEWEASVVLKTTKTLRAAFSHFIKFLIKNNLNLAPTDFLLMQKKPCFWTYIKEHGGLPARNYTLKMYEFTEWIIKDRLSDEEDGEYITLASSLLPLDVYHHVMRFTTTDHSGKAENVKAILPIKYLNLIRQILLEDNHAWPKSLDWTFKTLLNQQTGNLEKVWHPHFTYLYLFMLEVPIRKIQVLCLDSGEGDDVRWMDGKWQPNNSENALYWSKKQGDTLGRGVIRKTYSEDSETTAIYINTNKTQDIGKGFGSTSGYTINWHNESVIKIVDFMRDWQEKYNPVKTPLAYRDLPRNTFSDSPTEAVYNLIPDRFYLFRYPLNNANTANYASAPPADYLTFRFWHQLMNELERRLRAMGEDVIITTGWTANLPSRSIFTPHSLRGSGLTALAEAGVPIEVLSKVVAGHASILMTLGYIKYNNAYISNVLDEARLKIEQNEQENYTAYLKNSTWDDAYKYAVFNAELKETEWESSKAAHLFENRQIGICPNSGTLCHEGGEQLRKSGNAKGVYGPVPGGNGNCVRCRFFMTGLPFLIPLWLKANKDLSDAQQISKEVDAANSKLEQLRSTRFNIAKEQGAKSISPSLQAEIKQVEALLDAKSAKLDEILSNAHATYNLVERVKTLANDDDSKLPALLNEQVDCNRMVSFKEVSHFKQRDFIVQASRLYPHIKDEKLELERNHFIDQIMFNMGMTPITLSSLTDAEKKSACDAAAHFLNSRLSDHELSMLESGKIELHELGIGNSDKENLSIAVEKRLKKIAITEVK